MTFERIFVVYPRGLRTGGPEALHQLVDSLRRQGQDAFLVAHPISRSHARVPEYAHYDAPETDRVTDDPGSAIVVPEVFTDQLAHIRQAERFCWWLSIDNAPYFQADWQVRDPWRVAAPTPPPTTNRPLDVDWLRGIRHLTQSHYAWSYLFTRLGACGSMLTDYTDVHRFDGGLPPAERRRAVAYNPTKSGLITELVRAAMPGVEFVPLQAMAAEEITAVLSQVAVYLDLGFHPGRDRLPREAALAGAVSVVARRGAAAFHVDVPLPPVHRIQATTDLPDAAAVLLTDVLHNVEHHADLQKAYRDSILPERAIFDGEVSSVFVEHLYGDDGTARYQRHRLDHS